MKYKSSFLQVLQITKPFAVCSRYKEAIKYIECRMIGNCNFQFMPNRSTKDLHGDIKDMPTMI